MVVGEIVRLPQRGGDEAYIVLGVQRDHSSGGPHYAEICPTYYFKDDAEKLIFARNLKRGFTKLDRESAFLNLLEHKAFWDLGVEAPHWRLADESLQPGTYIHWHNTHHLKLCHAWTKRDAEALDRDSSQDAVVTEQFYARHNNVPQIMIGFQLLKSELAPHYQGFLDNVQKHADEQYLKDMRSSLVGETICGFAPLYCFFDPKRVTITKGVSNGVYPSREQVLRNGTPLRRDVTQG
ncbi:MAG: hypothetical protein FWF24_02465 [Alphaproteobacteria bacterium]|nr:hypothetical protein [Alphaproteobacteria bacterium]